jgi:hypothetical protein
MVLAQIQYEDQWNRIETQIRIHTAMPTLTYDGEKTASSTNVAGKICLQKTETRSMPVTL